MIRQLIKSSNIFSFESYWKATDKRNWSSLCGVLVSIPLLSIIIILFVLKLLQMVNNGIVVSNTQVNYSNDAPFTTLSAAQKNPLHAPFMLGFSLNIDNVNCPNSAISFQAFANQYSGSYKSANRTLSKIPLSVETCNDNHFAMLPGKMGKLSQWTINSLYCLSSNSSLQIGGSNVTSDLYKNIQFRFNCPSQCGIQTCGYVEFFAVSSTANLGNATFPYTYGLSRNTFSITTAPKYQVSYQIDSSNMTTDNSVFPFSSNTQNIGASVGNVVTDIQAPVGDTNTYVTIQRSDKTIIYNRSYYKIFDLFAYMGGIIYGFFLLLSFLRQFSMIQFQYNFAAECLRAQDSRGMSFRDYLKQILYEIVKFTPWRPDWKLAQQRKKSREATNKVLDVIYLNKRLAFLEEAISIVFQKHQLKGIHLLHNLNKDKVHNRITAHRFRDRLVYFFGRKYNSRSPSNQRTNSAFKPYDNQQCQAPIALNSSESIFKGTENNEKELKEQNMLELAKMNNVYTPVKQQKIEDIPQKFSRRKKPVKLTLKNLLSQQMLEDQEKINNTISENDDAIVNEAERFYSELASRELENSVNSRNDNTCLKKELKFVGDLNPDEFDEVQLVEELRTDMRKLVEEGEKREGNELSKKIYQKMDEWLKNYLRDTVKANSQ